MSRQNVPAISAASIFSLKCVRYSSALSEKTKEAKPAAHERIALLNFWAVPAFIAVMRLARRARPPTYSRYRGSVNKASARAVPTAEHDVEAPAASVPPVRAADGGDLAGVTVRSKPIVHRRANGAAADRRLSRTLVASDQQD